MAEASGDFYRGSNETFIQFVTYAQFQPLRLLIKYYN